MTDYDLFNAPQWNNFYNFTKLFSPAGAEFWKSVGNAFVMCIGTFISIGLSLLVAAILCGKIKFINFWNSCFRIDFYCIELTCSNAIAKSKTTMTTVSFSCI